MGSHARQGLPAKARGTGRDCANQVARHVHGKGDCTFPAGSTRWPRFAGSAHFLASVPNPGREEEGEGVLNSFGNSRPSPEPGERSQSDIFRGLAPGSRPGHLAWRLLGPPEPLGRGLDPSPCPGREPRVAAASGPRVSANPRDGGPRGETPGTRRATARGPRSATLCAREDRRGAGPGAAPRSGVRAAGGVTGSPRRPRRRRALGLSPPRVPEPRDELRPPLALPSRAAPAAAQVGAAAADGRAGRGRGWGRGRGPGKLRGCPRAPGARCLGCPRAQAWVSTRAARGSRGVPGTAPREGLGDRARLATPASPPNFSAQPSAPL